MNQKNRTILIVDDEILALSYLKDTIEDCLKNFSDLKDYKVFGVNNYQSFMDMVQENKPDIIFLDVQMPKKNGLEIAQEIRDNHINLGYSNKKMPIIIFVTAYENYGYQAFRVGAYDYLLKPVDEESVNDVFDSIVHEYGILNLNKDEKISIGKDNLNKKIDIEDIIYFKADMKYVVAKTQEDEHIINETLINLEEKHPNFIKIHRAYLVNPSYIENIIKEESSTFLSLKNQNELLPVSRRQKPILEEKLKIKP